MTLRYLLLSQLVAGCLPTFAVAQGLSFAVPTFELERKALDAQRRAYRAEDGRNEVLYCVEDWATASGGSAEARAVVKRVRRAHRGGPHNIAAMESQCVAADGKSLPTIHTHSEGNCQFSPADLMTIAARRAPFDGVQCGDRHFIWITSWQIIAMSAGVEVLREARSGVAPP